MGDYKKLQVWQKAHALALIAHRAATSIRSNKYSALRTQIVRAAMSIPTNIVEGRAQKSERDFVRFLGYAAGSAAELEYHIQLAHDFGVINPEMHSKLVSSLTEVRKMLSGLIRRIQTANS
jgi:four helix bundle protein